MRKLVVILAMLMLFPAAAFGIQYDLMNDGSMDEVTGQSGVSIAMDDIQLFLNIERLAWIDCDGFDCSQGTTGDYAGNAGAVGIQNFQIDVLTINAIVNTVARDTGDGNTNGYNLASSTCGDLDLNWDYDNTSTETHCAIAPGYGSFSDLGTQTLGLNNYGISGGIAAGGAFMPSALTIDATSQLPVMTEMKSNIATNNGEDAQNWGGVLIGLPTIEIYIPDMSLTPAFYNVEGHEPAANDVDGDTDLGVAAADYGTIEMGGITFAVLGGWIEIAPH